MDLESTLRPDEASDLRLGIGSYAFAWAVGVAGYPAPARPLDAFGLLDQARNLGLDLMHICDNLPLHERSESELHELAQAAAGGGVTVEIGTRGTEPRHLERYLQIAGALKAPLVRTLATGSLAQAERDLAAVLPSYERAGVRLALENYEAQPSTELAALIRRLGSPWLGVCLDTVNSLGALEPPDRVVETLLPLTFSLHVKDFTIEREDHRMGFRVSGMPAGEGLLEIAPLLEGLAALAGRQGVPASVVIELWPPYSGSIGDTVRLEADWARRSAGYLRGLWKRSGS